MTSAPHVPLVAVDIGNSHLKLATFSAWPPATPLPQPDRVARLELDWSDEEIDRWLGGAAADFQWTIASVNRPVANRLLEWLARRGAARVHLLAYTDLPLVVDVANPHTVGLDRLVDAVAANRLRDPHEPAIVVGLGSAITVNLVDREGRFAGGAILPGVAMAARALHEFTDGLPAVDVTDAPQVLERSTVGAIRYGLYWGTVGAVREVISRLTPAGCEVQTFLTGGGAPALAAILAEGSKRSPQLVPHLTLAGVALSAEHVAKGRP